MKKLFSILLVIALFVACNSKTSKNSASVVAQPDTVLTILHVDGMTCDHCEMAIQGSVAELAGVIEVKANHEDSTTFVKYDASKVGLDAIDEAIAKKGYKVVGTKIAK